MKFFNRNKPPSNYAVFKGSEIIGGSLSYEDVPKYLSSIDQFRSQGAGDMADTILAKMVETGHPAALAVKAEDLLLRSEEYDEEAIELFEKAVLKDDSDSLLKYGTWILRGRIRQDKIDDAFDMLREVANRGYAELVIAAPAYYLKQIALGINHEKSNQKLNEWLKIWNPKGFKKYEKGKIGQEEFLGPIAKEAGLESTE
jgi:TPR repeat protein